MAPLDPPVSRSLIHIKFKFSVVLRIAVNYGCELKSPHQPPTPTDSSNTDQITQHRPNNSNTDQITRLSPMSPIFLGGQISIANQTELDADGRYKLENFGFPIYRPIEG